MSRSYRAGLVILALLSLVDVAGPLLTDGETPPMAIALVGCALGVASLVCVVLAWRGVTRAVLPLVVLRLLSALSARAGVLRLRRPTVPSVAWLRRWCC